MRQAGSRRVLLVGVQTLLLLFFLALGSRADSTFTKSYPLGLKTTRGSASARVVTVLSVQDQSGTANDSSRYISFSASWIGYTGEFNFQLPADLDLARITALSLAANYRGAPATSQRWRFDMRKPATGSWVTIGDNAGAVNGVWSALQFPVSSDPGLFVSADRKLRVRFITTSKGAKSALDYLAVTVQTDIAPPASITPSVTSGYDWSLPATVSSDPDSGFFPMDGEGASSSLMRHRGYTVTWAELNPAEGVYDFSLVRSYLSEVKQSGGGLILRLKTNTVYEVTDWGNNGPFLPQWVLDRHNPPIVDVNPTGSPIRVAAPWNAGVQAEYAKFVQAFGAQRFQDDPALLGLYVHGLSTSLGEEMWLDEGSISNLQAAGMSSCSLLTNAMENRIQWWANAFGAAKGKLIWVSSVWLLGGVCTNDDANHMNQFALNAGLGLRYGSIDLEYNGAVKLPVPYEDFGQHIDSNGYLTTDWTWPVISGRRAWSDENEEYDLSSPSAPYMFRNSLLRSLELGERLVWTTGPILNLNPDLSRYWTLTAGKTAQTSPDAWVSLREAKVRFGGSCYTVKNFERWLHQRDATGATTVPALYTQRAPTGRDCDLNGDGQTEPGEYDARALGAGSSGMGFTIDGEFMGPAQSASIELKVTFVDQGSPWSVEWCSVNGLQRTGQVQVSGDGQTKTATFNLPDFQPSRCVGGQFDFSLKGSGTFNASFVRIVR